jgi:hypothetical protein
MMRPKLLLALPVTLALAACFGGHAPSQLLTLTPAEMRPVATPGLSKDVYEQASKSLA